MKKKKRYEEISNLLATELKTLPPNSPACSQMGICERFKVSDGTAKKVMAQLRADGVIYSRVGSGSFTTSQSRRSTILMISNLLNVAKRLNPISAGFIGGAQILCSSKYQQYSILAADTTELPKMASEIKSVYPGIVGVIFVRQPKLFYDYSEQLEKQGLATAFYGSSAYFNSHRKYNYLIYNEYQIADIAVSALYNAGCRSIGCTFTSDFEVFHARHEGYRRALKKYGLKYNKDHVLDCTSIKDCEKFGTPIWKSRREAREFFIEIDGLFCHIDRVAFNLLNSACDAGFNIPEDLKVIGVDNHPAGELFKPALASIDINVNKDAQVIVELLIDAIEKGKRFQEFTPTPLIKRESIL